MTRAGLSILAAILLMAPLAAWLVRNEVPAAGGQAVRRFVQPARCLPEPGERAAFLASALGLSALIFATAPIGRRSSGVRRPGLPVWVDDAAGLALMGLALGITIVGVRNEDSFYLLMNGFHRGPSLAIPLLAATAGLLWRGRRGGASIRATSHALAAATIAAMALARVFGEAAEYARHTHFEPLYHPMVQVVLGKTILVDMVSQYGLYPHFLAPIFAAFGLGVVQFTLVLAVLVAAVLAAFWAFLCGATENRAVALVGFLALVANGTFMLFKDGVADPYFQYMPIRMVFPAASIWLSWRYLRGPSRRAYGATLAVLAVGPLWNLDSGLPALAAWVGMLGYRELAGPGRGWGRRLARVAGHAAIAGSAAGVAVLAYSAATLLRSGRLPDFAGFVAYQAMFYASGFFMLPMPLLGGWCAVALAYLAGLAYSARALASGCVTPRSAIVFHLAALGIGLFPYYQGRSHPMVLTLAWWPAFLLLTLFLDELASDWGRAPLRLPRVAWAAALVWVLGGSAWSLAWYGGFLREWYGSHLFAAMRSGPSPLAPEMAMLKEAVRPGDRLLIVSRNESHFGAALRLPSAWRSSLVESILVDDFRAIAGRVDRGEFDRVFVDDSISDSQFHESIGLPEQARIINRGTTVASSPRARLIRPGPGVPPLLGAGGSRLDVRYEDGRAEGKVAEPPMAVGPRFTLEAVVRPTGEQAPMATILGNLPGGAPPFASGFGVQQNGADGNAYALFGGDGRAYSVLAEFRLDPGRWNYLAIVVGGGTSSTYVDGRLVDSRPIPDPVKIADSDLPVVLGNWLSRDRPFRGLIAEARLTDRPIGGDEIRDRWASAAHVLEATAARESAARR